MPNEIFEYVTNVKDIIFIILTFFFVFKLINKAPEIINSFIKAKEQEKMLIAMQLKLKYLENDMNTVKHDISELRKWQHDIQITMFNKDIRSGGI